MWNDFLSKNIYWFYQHAARICTYQLPIFYLCHMQIFYVAKSNFKKENKIYSKQIFISFFFNSAFTKHTFLRSIVTLKHLSFLSKVCREKQIIFENLNKINKRKFFMRNANDRNWTKNPKPTSRVKSWSSDQRVLKIFYYIYKCKN